MVCYVNAMSDENHVFLDRKPGLYLKHTDAKGRGVFATTDIAKGDTLEVTPAIVLNEDQSPQLEETTLNNYVFKLGDVSEEMKQKLDVNDVENAVCVVMGMGSFCNHDEHPNAQILWQEHESGLYYSLEAIADIPAGTEICTSYGDTWFSDRDMNEE